jgi:hypothetical protein
VVLPSARDAADWFVAAARTAVDAGEPLDADAVRLLMALAPGDPVLLRAIDAVSEDAVVENTASDTLASHAREAVAQLRAAVAARDETRARETVTALETEVLRVYQPRRGLGRFEDDVAVALAMMAAYDVGADETHLMMAEELMLGVTRRQLAQRMQENHRLDHLAWNCEAAVALAALAARTQKNEYRERALEVMHDYAASYRTLGVRAAAYVSALQMIS